MDRILKSGYVPSEAARKVMSAVRIPTIGIGAGLNVRRVHFFYAWPSRDSASVAVTSSMSIANMNYTNTDDRDLVGTQGRAWTGIWTWRTRRTRSRRWPALKCRARSDHRLALRARPPS